METTSVCIIKYFDGHRMALYIIISTYASQIHMLGVVMFMMFTFVHQLIHDGVKDIILEAPAINAVIKYDVCAIITK